MKKKAVGILRRERIEGRKGRRKASKSDTTAAHAAAPRVEGAGARHQPGKPAKAARHRRGAARPRPVTQDGAVEASAGDQRGGGASDAQPAAAAAAAAGRQRDEPGVKRWGCSSVVDRQAAKAVAALLAAGGGGRGATIKGLTLAPHITAKRATFKVVCETLRLLPRLRQLLEGAQLLAQHRQLTEAVALVLCYECVFGEGLKPHGPAERALLAAKPQLLEAARLLEPEAQPSSDPPPRHPRAARVNTLKLGVAAALSHLSDASQPGWQPAFQELRRDDLLPDVLLFLPGTDLHDHPLVASGALILQSKASCMPAHALAPEPGWRLLDCCAAPGNKTTHLAALLCGRGSVLALDRDARRLKRLQAAAALTGADRLVTARCADFLSVDWEDPEYGQVQGILLDPSCSGSGTGASRMDHLLPPAPAGRAAQEGQRVAKLAAFQKQALAHALRCPGLQRLVYSTCSVHAEENEEVVAAVLPEAEERGFRLAHALPRWPRRGLPLLPGAERLVRTDPAADGTDGFFLAVFERTPGG